MLLLFIFGITFRGVVTRTSVFPELISDILYTFLRVGMITSLVTFDYGITLW